MSDAASSQHSNSIPERETDALKIALQASEERHRIISGLISDYAYSMRVAPDGSLIREWHAGNFSTITGYADEDLDRLEIWQRLIHPEDWNKIAERVSALHEGRAIISEYRIVTADGHVRWLRDYGQPILNEAGELVRVYGASQDITEQKLAQEQLQHSEEEFRSIFELAGTGKAQADPTTGRLLRVNQRLSDMLGYSRAELMHMRINDLTHPEDHQIDQETYRLLVVEGGTHHSFDKRYIHKNGPIVWAHLELTLVRDSEGRPLHYVASILDITRRRQDEERIRFQATLLNAVQQAVIATDISGKVTFWNQHAEALYGWPAAETIGRNIINLNVSPAKLEDATTIMMALSRGEMWTGEFETKRRDGSIFQVEVTDSPVIDNEGHVIGVIGISQDVTERKQLQEYERMLAAAGQLLVESLSTEQRADRLTNLMVDQFAEVCTITLVNENGNVIFSKYAHHDPAMAPVLEELSNYTPSNHASSTFSQALRTSQPVFMPVVPKDFKQKTALSARHAALREQLGFHSMITVPLIARGNTLGVISVSRSARRPNFQPRDYNLMVEVSRNAAMYFDNARLYEQTQAMNAELEQRVARRTAELMESQSQYRQLVARVQSTREEERRRIAREVHDVIGQLLTSLKMEANWLALKLSEAGSPLAERTTSMISILDSAFQSVRQIATELRPTLLDDMGLIAAMEWQVEDFQNRSGIQCRFESTLDNAPMSTQASTALFRILQEALTNVARHAGATRVSVTVEEDHRGWFVLQVTDNGRGISDDALRQTQSLGLLGMRERVHLLNGELDIKSAPGKGTTLTARLPIVAGNEDETMTD